MNRIFTFVLVLFAFSMICLSQGRGPNAAGAVIWPAGSYANPVPRYDQRAAGQEYNPGPVQPLKMLASVKDLAGHVVCDVGVFSNRQIAERALFGSYGYGYSYSSYLYNSRPSTTWTGLDPEMQFSQDADNELREKLLNRVGISFAPDTSDPKICEYRAVARFAVRKEDFSGKESAFQFFALTDYAALAFGTASQTNSHHVAVKVWFEVYDPWKRMVGSFTGTGHDLVMQVAKQGPFSNTYSVELGNSQPVAEGAALEIATGIESEATRLAKADASYTNADASLRRAKINTGAAQTRGQATREQIKAAEKEEKEAAKAQKAHDKFCGNYPQNEICK